MPRLHCLNWRSKSFSCLNFPISSHILLSESSFLHRNTYSTLVISYLINPTWKISNQEKSDNYIWKFLQWPLKLILLTWSANVWSIFFLFYWLQMTWILELAGQQRMMILENLNWLYATWDKSWPNLSERSKSEWKKCLL